MYRPSFANKKSNEILEVKDLLKIIDIKDIIVTWNALKVALNK
jgi:predicted transposase YbfD/YdcC